MSKSFYLKILLSAIVITLFPQGYSYAQTEETQSTVSENVGRENPFLPIDSDRGSSLLSRVFGSGSRSTSTQPIPELFVQTVVLRFLDAKSLKTVLENMLSGYGNITVDARSNTLIISETKRNMEKILEEIRRADKAPPQIMIEVVILDVQLDDDTEIGVNWDILSDKMYDIGYRQNFTASGERLGSTIENAANIGNATAFNTTGLGGDFSVISGTIRNVVHLIQEKRDVEILASPRVMMVSGQSAYIEAVDEIPYQEQSSTSEGGLLTYYEFKDVGVKLKVSATLTDSNDILLTVEAEQNVQVGTTTPPRVDTRKAQTSLLLGDGQVVILGGLRRQEKTKEVDQIPLLGDIPLLGFLFKSTNAIVKNSELLVFVSPHIYKDQKLTEEELAKFDEITKRPLLKMPDTWKQGMLPFDMLAEPNSPRSLGEAGDANDVTQTD